MAKQRMPSPEDIGKMWKKVGTGKVLGRACDIYEGAAMKSWLWKGLLLKQEIALMGTYLKEAVSVDVDIRIPATRFKPPAAVTITEPRMPPGGTWK